MILYASEGNAKRSHPTTSNHSRALAERLLGSGEHYRQIARPLDWKFTRADLDRLLA
jgi:hypothetical protein